MKYRYAFLLGRPGCGKTALYRELSTRILESGRAETCERVDDFPKVWARLHGDDDLEKEGKERLYSRRSDDGVYHITDETFLDEILKEVNADVLKIDKPDHLIFLEFARTNYVEAMQHFDRRILDHCIAIYMEVSFDICWARNVARHAADMSQEGDDHFVYRETMEKLYLHDDQDAFVLYMEAQNIPVLVVNNEADGKEHLRRQVEQLLKNLF
jgi:adenylate kinase family enzyme